ncbi:hypothetical protein [Mycoplasma hafezii]|uniref:hypothetical protein n=1 Tax=Mycoplasma hafezii TaxID=525886 RepID=UPI003CFB11F3
MKKRWLWTLSIPCALPLAAVSCNVQTDKGNISLFYSDAAQEGKKGIELHTLKLAEDDLQTIYDIKAFALNSLTNLNEEFTLKVRVTADNYVAENKTLKLKRSFILQYFGFSSVLTPVNGGYQINNELLHKYRELISQQLGESKLLLQYGTQQQKLTEIRKIIKFIADLDLAVRNA